jgi:hypothetical protein
VKTEGEADGGKSGEAGPPPVSEVASEDTPAATRAGSATGAQRSPASRAAVWAALG